MTATVSLRPVLSFVLLAAPLAAQWSSDPALNQAVVERPGDQVLPKAAATSDGGSWVGFFDNASGSYRVYVQRYDSKGNALLAPGGLLVSQQPQSSSLVDWDLIADSADDAVLVFTDTRNGGDLDVYAYRIASDGTFLWGGNGVTLSANPDFESDPRVVEASNGDFVFVWNFLGSPSTLRMQRLDPAGNPLLTLGGADIVSEPGHSPGFAEMVPAAAGSVIVSWVRDINFFTNVKHLRADRFDAAGTPIWSAPVEVFDAYNLPIAYSPELRSDGAGGVLLVWHASDPATFLFDSFVQHLDGAGNELLPHNGVSLSTTPGMNHLDPDASFVSSTGDIIAFWNEKDGSQNLSGLYAQKIDAQGNRAWGAGGLMILPVNGDTKFPPRTLPLGDGAEAFLTWTPGGTYGQDQLLSVRVDGAGNLLWGGPRDLCTRPSSKSVRLGVAQEPDGEAVVYWEDSRNGTPDLYGQDIHPDGGLGARFLSVDVATISLSAGGIAHFSLDAGAAHGGQSYVLLGSDTGTSPGQSAAGILLPLNDGPYFQFTWHHANNPVFSAFRGVLAANGQASAALSVPPGSSSAYVGRTLAHAFVVLASPGTPILASEARSFQLLP